MQKIVAIIWKDMFLRFSSMSDLLFFLILPILFTFLLGGGFARPGSDNEADARIPLLVVNEDQSALSNTLLQVLDANETVRIEERPGATAETAFTNEEAPVLLHIPAGFATDLLAGNRVVLDLREQPDSADAAAAARAVRAAVAEISQPLTAARSSVEAAAARQPFVDAAARDAYFAGGLQMARSRAAELPESVVVSQPETAVGSTSDYDPAVQSSAGQLITWVFIPLLGISSFLAFERMRGTLRRLLTTPTHKATYLLGTIAGQLLAGLVQMSLLVAFGVLVMGVNWGRSPAGLALILVPFGLASVAFGTMLGTFVKTGGQANNLSIMLGMSMALLGGCWWPMELFPPFMQTAVRALPTTWAMEGLTDLALRGLGAAAVWPEAIALLGFALLFFVVGILRFRYE